MREPPRVHQHWGTVAREADPRIVIDTATARRGGWVTLILSAPSPAPFQHLRPIYSPTRERALEVHGCACEWVQQLASAVVCDPEVCNGRPVIRGTRVWVDCVLAHVDRAGQLDWDEFHTDYPSVRRPAAEAVASLPGHVRRTLAGSMHGRPLDHG